MIAKIGNGKSTAGLIRYLFDTKKTKDHTDPHLVTSWDGFAPDPGRADDFDATKMRLVADLDLRVKQARRLGRAPERHVWHCSVRAAPGDRHLTDAEWADIAHRIVAATGIAPQGDPDGCRWVAVRHADDHIHIAATKVRGDLRTARHWNDYLTAHKELAAIEKEYGLKRVVRGDRTAAQRPTRAETEKARRARMTKTSRECLRTTVRQLVSIATSPQEFLRLLADVEGVLVDVQHFPSGDVRGYKVAVEGDANAAGEPIWFSGAKLAPDLSFPKIRERLTVIKIPPATQPGCRRQPNPWHQATAAAERIPHHLDHGDEAAAQAHITALGEAIDVLPLLAPSHLRSQLQQAATAFERATRSRIRAQQDQARALRGAIRALRTAPVTGDGSGLAMFLDITVLVVIATARWHQARRHDQQVAAAHQALVHLQAAYQQAAAAPLAALAQRKPLARTMERHAKRILVTLPDHAQQVLNDPAWPVLATALTEAENAGHDPDQLLQHAARQYTLDDARSIARTLTWRVQRLSKGPAPKTRAPAAQARGATQPSADPDHTPATAALPEQLHARQVSTVRSG
ncbi:relaxase/mobilization nuclease domain-containing protein [Streptomyces beihaiensis]|uniref:Relaxase/mobilization nuclease domain-containing protein n=1 Tax=Streptomyces beihaiensis TaxID=2984495 RepID=A0ABT3TUN8_9ACTN|nr:mobilization protein [Streptomyces beihaiensis]MCX3060734.1 relaxase/mobilization nuclease domain-containing protein [Streptomyces beihaiensis]